MSARVVSIHCIGGGGLEAKTLKLTLPAAWAASPSSRLLKAVAKKCGGADVSRLVLETAAGTRVSPEAAIETTAGRDDGGGQCQE